MNSTTADEETFLGSFINDLKKYSPEYLIYYPFIRFFIKEKAKELYFGSEAIYILLSVISISNWPFVTKLTADYFAVILWLIILLYMVGTAFAYKPNDNTMNKDLILVPILLAIVFHFNAVSTSNIPAYFGEALLAGSLIAGILFAFFWKDVGKWMGFGSVRYGFLCGFILGYAGLVAFSVWVLLSVIAVSYDLKVRKTSTLNNYRGWLWLLVIFVFFIFVAF